MIQDLDMQARLHVRRGYQPVGNWHLVRSMGLNTISIVKQEKAGGTYRRRATSMINFLKSHLKAAYHI